MLNFRFRSIYRGVAHYEVTGDGDAYRIEQDRSGAFGRVNGGSIPPHVCLAFQQWRDEQDRRAGPDPVDMAYEDDCAAMCGQGL